MKTVLRGAVLAEPQRSPSWPAPVDIVVVDRTIEQVVPAGSETGGADAVVDLGGSVVLPGLVNAHAHNHELYLKGTGWGLPLEPYILANSPHAPGGSGLSPAQLYDRTLASALEMVRNGVTAVADDVIHPRLDRETVEAVLTAYRDSGMRARVSMMVEDSPWRRSIPLRDAPAGYDPLLDARPHDPLVALALYRDLLGEWGDPAARVSLMVSPSAPQRCSPEFLRDLVGLSRECGLRFHVHVQETLSQRAHGRRLFHGRTMIRYLADEGLLGPETMIAHAIWVDDDELSRIAHAGAHVVHNPVSNAKLGSGIAPVRRMLDAGVDVALGTDGLTCNDALDMLAVAKAAVTMSALADTDPSRWLTPADALDAMTRGGSRAAGFHGGGRIEPGAPADLVVLDPAAYAFVPCNDPVAQSVFSAGPRDVVSTMVDGVWLVRDREVIGHDVASVHSRVREAARRFWEEAAPSLADNAHLAPYVDRSYRHEAAAAAASPDPYRLIPPWPTG